MALEQHGKKTNVPKVKSVDTSIFELIYNYIDQKLPRVVFSDGTEAPTLPS